MYRTREHGRGRVESDERRSQPVERVRRRSNSKDGKVKKVTRKRIKLTREKRPNVSDVRPAIRSRTLNEDSHEMSVAVRAEAEGIGLDSRVGFLLEVTNESVDTEGKRTEEDIKRLSTNTRDRLIDRDSRTETETKESNIEIELTISNRDDVSSNVGREIVGESFDYRKR